MTLRPMLSMNVSEFACSANWLTSVFHGLSAGNMAHWPGDWLASVALWLASVAGWLGVESPQPTAQRIADSSITRSINREYLEQPIPEEPLLDSAWLRQQTITPIALNESVVGPASVIDIIKKEAAAFVLPDTHIACGILPCATIGRICEAAGIGCIMHCGHDLGPKTAAMVHVAAAGPAYSLANDCTYYGLEDDFIREPLVIRNGKIAVPDKPGLGIEGDPEKIERYRVDC